MRFAGIDTGSLAEDLRQAARAAGDWSGKDTRLLQALGHAVTSDQELARALREALVDPEIAALEEMLARGVARGEVRAGHPALEYIPAMMFGVPGCGRCSTGSTPTPTTWSGSWSPRCCPPSD